VFDYILFRVLTHTHTTGMTHFQNFQNSHLQVVRFSHFIP